MTVQTERIPEAVGLGEQVWLALAGVRDPELDEAITELGFVEAVSLEGRRVSVRLRLPTYFCAANFAYMMVLGAREAVESVAGVGAVDVVLADHYAADEINLGVGAAHSFAETFPEEANGDLAELRSAFAKKAYLAALERSARALVELGRAPEGLAGATLGELPESAGRARLLRCREQLRLAFAQDAPLMVDPEGVPVPAGVLWVWLRRAKAVRVSIDANAQLCRGLLETRYLLDELADHSCDGAT